MILQARDPALIAAGFRQCGAAVVEVLQVFEQHAPGHAVHRQVVDHQQQTFRAVGHRHPQRAQQRAILQIETALGFVAQGVELLDRLRLTLPQHRLRGRCWRRFAASRFLPVHNAGARLS